MTSKSSYNATTGKKGVIFRFLVFTKSGASSRPDCDSHSNHHNSLKPILVMLYVTQTESKTQKP